MASKSLPARGGPDTKAVATGPPNQTLFCTQLPDKRIPKHDLRTALYALFSTYGTILDIVVMKTSKMRGQAHVVFKDVQASTQALRALQGFEFFGKQMKIVYAKGSSNIISKLRGTYVAPVEQSVPAPVTTDLQKSIFGAPPSALPARPTTGANGEPQGLKRAREEESDNEEAPMDEDSDVPMEASSDEE